jgi:alcohol dehydrogenase class IV
VEGRFRFLVPVEIRFGQGEADTLPEVLTRLSTNRLMCVTDAALNASGLVARVLAGVHVPYRVEARVPGNPSAADVGALLEDARAFAPDTIVAVGGGSPVDVAKVLSLLLTNPGELHEYQWENRPVTKPVLPLVAIPTTAGTGAEVSRAAVIVDRGQKQGIARDELFPRVAIVDPELTRTLPPNLTAATALDAFAHAAEALVARGANPLTDAWALAAAAMIHRSLPRALADGEDMTARGELALAATMAGAAMAVAGLGIIHALASPLGGRFNIHHGLTNALLLPAAIRFNRPVVAERYAELARAIGYQGSDREAAVDWLEKAVTDLVVGAGITFDLRPHGVRAEDVRGIAEEAAGNWMARTNPRPVAAEDCVAILTALL